MYVFLMKTLKTKDGIEIRHGVYTVQAVYRDEVICAGENKTDIDIFPVDELVERARKWIRENIDEDDW